MLTKHNVCLYIKDEEHLEEMKSFLESQKEETGAYFWFSTFINDNYLQCSILNEWQLFCKDDLTEVTTEQFKKLWE